MLRQWNVHKLQGELFFDLMTYGTCCAASHERKWWNPMRALFGRFKLVRIAPEAFFKEVPLKSRNV